MRIRCGRSNLQIDHHARLALFVDRIQSDDAALAAIGRRRFQSRQRVFRQRLGLVEDIARAVQQYLLADVGAVHDRDRHAVLVTFRQVSQRVPPQRVQRFDEYFDAAAAGQADFPSHVIGHAKLEQARFAVL